MGTIIIPRNKNKFVKNFDNDPLAEKYVDIIYARRGKLGKILKGTTKKRVNLPKGVKLTKVENNKPGVGAVKISYKRK